MSEFFNINLHPNVIIDDSQTSTDTVWSSEETLKEIVKYRITKFEELTDVDVVNRKDKQIIGYSAMTGKFTTIDGADINEISGLGLKQVSKMGIIGTKENPFIINIPINTIDFKFPKLNILKFVPGFQDVITIETNFDNSESNDFMKDDKIIFDGTAHLKNEYEYKMDPNDAIGTYDIYSVELDPSEFKKITNINSLEKGVDNFIEVNAIPKDRLLIPTVDINLSNVEHIDDFMLKGAGINNKVIVSTDSGHTWKTWYGGTWKDIDLTLDNTKKYGMSLDTFNSIGIHWNEIITSKKVRFAYLYQQDNADVIENYDELKIQYDGQGMWVEAKDSEYDVVYASNSLLQIKLYFSGDVKLNY